MKFDGGDKMTEKHPIEIYLKKVEQSFKKAGVEGGYALGFIIRDIEDDFEIDFGGKTNYNIKGNWLHIQEFSSKQEIEVNHLININELLHIQEL
ncbi:MAG: hypothetical protein V3V00_16155 [Saprospiraceae bacterium]